MCGYRLDLHVDSNVRIVELLQKICTCTRAWICMDCHADVLCSEALHGKAELHTSPIFILTNIKQILRICILLHTCSFNAFCMYTHMHRTRECVALEVIYMGTTMHVYSEYCSRCVHADMLWSIEEREEKHATLCIYIDVHSICVSLCTQSRIL